MTTTPISLGLVGAGRIGAAHAQTIAQRVPNGRLVAVADALPGAAVPVANRYGATPYDDPQALMADPDVDGVVIAASSVAHRSLIEAAAAAGKPVFCEKPMSMTLADADAAIAAADRAGVALQVGFNRRFDAGFAAAHAAVVEGKVGRVQLMRSLTRDPGLARPDLVPPWTIFTQTLIHDFDALLWLNPGAEAVEVYATADALVAPDYKDSGLLDTAVVVVAFDNGARGVAEASFSATYGYDVRAEVFGSGGMVTAGEAARSSMRLLTSDGLWHDTPRGDTELFADAYAGEFVEFCDAVRSGREPAVTGRDARRALAVALACIESVERGGPVAVAGAAAGVR